MKNFIKFLSLFPNQGNKSVETNTVDNIPHPLKDDFSLWYKHHDYLFCYNMIVNGYPANEKIKKEIIDNLTKSIEKKQDYILDIHNSLGYVPSDLKFIYLSNWGGLSKHNSRNPKNDDFYEKIKEILNIEPKVFLDYFINQSDFLTTNICKCSSCKKSKTPSLTKRDKRFEWKNDEGYIYARKLKDLTFNFNYFFIENINKFTVSESLQYKNALENIKSKIEHRYHTELKITEHLNLNLRTLGVFLVYENLDKNSELHKAIHSHFMEEKTQTISKIKSLNIETNIQEKITALNNDKNVKNLPQEIQYIIQEINFAYFKLKSQTGLNLSQALRVEGKC